jgi:uncharacterized protein involved in exopolysaccharide biosynthesis
MAEGKDPNNQSSNATPDGGGTEQSSRATPYAGYQPAPGMPPAMAYDYRDDEISLYELWNVLVRRRLMIGAVFLVATIAAAAFGLSRTPAYSFDAVIEIGEMPNLSGGGLQAVEKPSVLVTRINEVIVPAIVDRTEEETNAAVPRLEAEVMDGGAAFVRLSAEVNREQESAVREDFNQLIQRVIARHEAVMTQRRRALTRKLSRLEQEVQQVVQARSELFSGLKGLPQLDEETATETDNLSAAAITLGGIVDLLLTRETEHEVADLEARVERINQVIEMTRPTQVLRGPALANEPEGQPTSTIVALGAVLGLMLGVFAAFGREFLANAAAQAESG